MTHSFFSPRLIIPPQSANIISISQINNAILLITLVSHLRPFLSPVLNDRFLPSTYAYLV